MLVSLAKPIIGVIFVINADDKVTARILGLVLAELIGYTWTFFDQIKKGKRLYSKKYWLYALGFNLPLVPHYLIISKILFYFRFETHVSYTYCTIYLNYFKTYFNIA